MSVAAIMMVKDEADIIEQTVLHLLGQVDEVIVADNISADGTWQTLQTLAHAYPDRIRLAKDDEPAYYQSRKMTELAEFARCRGHDWVLPCDADEIWYSKTYGSVKGCVEGMPTTVKVVGGLLLNHVATSADDADETNPILRLRYRLKEINKLPKVCARTATDLVITMGNHEAEYSGVAPDPIPLLMVDHFSWRTPRQYAKKIQNGAAAYALTNIPKQYGVHWRGLAHLTEEELMARFLEVYFYEADDDRIILDPTYTLA